MKDLETKQKFIELRANDYSFDKIVKELDISKVTAIKWNRRFKLIIQKIRLMNYESLFEKALLTKNHKIKLLSKMFKRLYKEFLNRKFDDIPTDKLIDNIAKIQQKLEIEIDSLDIENEINGKQSKIEDKEFTPTNFNVSSQLERLELSILDKMLTNKEDDKSNLENDIVKYEEIENMSNADWIRKMSKELGKEFTINMLEKIKEMEENKAWRSSLSFLF